MIIGSLPLCASRFFWFPNDINLKKLLLFYENVSIGDLEEEIEIAEKYKYHVGLESDKHNDIFKEFISGLYVIMNKGYNTKLENISDDSLPDYVNSYEELMLTKSQQLFFAGNYQESMMFVLTQEYGLEKATFLRYNHPKVMDIVRKCYKNYFDKITKQYSCIFNTVNIYDRSIPTIFDIKKSQFNQKEVKKEMINITLLKYPEVDTNKIEWSKLIEFKDDKYIRLSQKKFLNWFNKLTIDNFNPKIYMQEFEYLIEEYRTSLELHEMKYKYSPVKSTIINSGELVENLLKLNITKAGKQLMNFSKEKIEYLEAKKNLSGSELAYIESIKELEKK